MEQPTQKDLAEYFRLALEIGVRVDAEVEAWADEIIVKWGGEIPTWLLGLSSEQDESKRKLLEAVPGTAVEMVVWNLVLARLRRAVTKNELSHEQVVNILYRWVLAKAIPDVYSGAANTLDNVLFGAKDGYYSREQFLERFDRFFLPFRDYEALLPKEHERTAR